MARKWRRGSLGKTSLSGANHGNESTTPAQTSDNVQDSKDIPINQMNDERMSPTKEEATTPVMVETPRTSTDIIPPSSSGRSQRVRKKPKHLDNDDLEVDWGITGQSSYTKNANILFEKSTKKSSPPNQEQAAAPTISPTISSDIENDLEQVDDDLPSLLNDDDPHKVWCNCRKPHGNRDMIECEACEYWFHIECVNVTKRQLKEYDKKKQDWFCSPCTAELGKGVTRRNLKRQTRLRIFQLETQELAQREASLKLKKQSLPLKNHSSGSKQNERATEDSDDSTMTDDDHFDGQGKSSNKLSNTPKKEMKDRGELRLKKLIKRSKKELGQKQMKHMMKDSDSALVKETGNLEPSSLTNLSTSDIHHDEEFSKEITVSKKDPLNTKHFPDQMENFFENSPALPQGSTLYVTSSTPSSSISQGNGSNQRSPYAGKSSDTLRRASTSSSTSLDNSSGQEVPCPACAKKRRLESESSSIFCNSTCVQAHVSDMLKMLRTHKKQKEKGNPVEAQKPLKVTLINRFNQTTLSGKDALLEKNVLQFVSKNPIYEVMSPSSVALISNKNRLQNPLVKGNSNVSKSQSVHRDSISGKTATATQIKGDAKKTSKDSPGQKLERSSSLSGKEDHEQWARKQLKEIFELRYNELPEKYKKNGIKSNSEILNKLAEKIVDELKKTYSNKFLAKCRSLMFNLKDERNKGNLCRRVILGKIPPSQLVNMSFEDLAPSELKNWRENEKKTSIELIKREAVDQANQVIMKKTHKGEEFLSGKNDLISELAVPDSIVKHETESTSKDFNISAEVQKPIVLKAEVASSKVMSVTLPPVNQPTQTESSSKSYSIDAATSISQAQQESSVNQGSYEPKQRSDLLDDTLLKGKSSSSTPAISQIVKEPTVRIGDETSVRSKPIRIRVEPDMSKILAQADKLLKKNGQAIMPRNTSITNSKPTAATVSPLKSHKPDISKLPGHHSSRNVELPPVWTGQISMPDQAKFFASAHVISGNLGANLSEEAGKLLLIAGRISPEQVADYITKLRASRQTEVGVLKFKFVTREERTGYDAFYHYLNARNRYGVVATASAKTYKEFYIMPLGMNHDVPKVLLPFKGSGLESKPRRENLLLGILIRTSKGHSGLTIIPTVGMAATGSSTQADTTSPERSYTPPLLNSGNTIPSNHDDDGGSYTPPYMPPSIVASSSKRQKNDYGSKSLHEPSSSKIPKYDPDEVKVKKTKNSTAVAMTSASTSKNGLSFNDQEFLDYFANCSNSEEMLNAIDSSSDSASLGAILEQMTNKTDNKRRLLEIEAKVAQETNEASSNGQGSNGNVSLNKLIQTIQIPDNLKDILKNVHDATIHAKSGQAPVNEICNDANNAAYKAMQSDPKFMGQRKQTNPGPQAVTHMSQNELLLKAQEQFKAIAKLENSSSERVTGGFCPPPPILQHSQHLRGLDRTQAQSFMPTSLQLPSQPPAILAPNGNNGSRMNEPGQNMYADFRRQQLPPLQPSPGPNQAGIPSTHPTISFGWKRRRT